MTWAPCQSLTAPRRRNRPRRVTYRRGGSASADRLLRLVEPQHKFVDFTATCLGEASVGRDDTKAALLEDALRRDVVVGDACVERTRRLDGQERFEGFSRDSLPPVG